MIRLKEAIIVEGRYDESRLCAVADALIVTTGGFNIFRDTQKQELIKRLALENGIIVFTDSDDAGFKIRKFINDIAAKGDVKNAYLPEVKGKESRKQKPGSAGLLGVEGVSCELLEKALLDASTQICEQGSAELQITAATLFEDGMTGTKNAQSRRMMLLRAVGFPTRLSTGAMIKLLNRLVGYRKYKELVGLIDD
ncbi:MAG: DUF4093 domain-containing protein [Oscillospiraceae bacterium]